MANTDPLLRPVLAYATTQSWEAARDMLARDPNQMLTDRAEQLLRGTITATLVIAPANQAYTALLQDRRDFLIRAREIGVVAAWAERQVPATVPPTAPAAVDPLSLPRLVGEWLDTPTYLDQRAYLASHQGLLDPLVDGIMASLVKEYSGKENERFLQASWQWLQRARTNGLEAGWQTFCQAMGIASDPDAAERMMHLLLDWLNTPSFDEQRSFLSEHPELLTPHVDILLESLVRQYAGQKEERLLRASLIWLQRARKHGLDAGWHAFQVAMVYDQPQSI